MSTYLLTGNPDTRNDPMNEDRYRDRQSECVRVGSSKGGWTVGYAREGAYDQA